MAQPEAAMEKDPDGNTQQVAVIMTGKVYRDAGLKHSKHPEVEGLLYDKLCLIGKHKLRDEVRKMALHIATSVQDKEFSPTVAWLDNFMRRFCLSKKKMGFHSYAMLKTKPTSKVATPIPPSSTSEKGVTQEEVFSALGFPKDFTGFAENLEPGQENGKASSAENGINGADGKEQSEAKEGKCLNGTSNDASSPSDNTEAHAQKDPPDESTEKEASEKGNDKASKSTSKDKDAVGNTSESSSKDRSVDIDASEIHSEDQIAEVDALGSPSEGENGDGNVSVNASKNESATKKPGRDAAQNVSGDQDHSIVILDDDDDDDPLAVENEGAPPVTVKNEETSKDNNKEAEDIEDGKKDTDEDELMEVDVKDNSSNDKDSDVEEDDSNATSNVSDSDDAGSDVVMSLSEDDTEKPKLTEREEDERKKSKQEEDAVDAIIYSKQEQKYFKKNLEDLQKRLNTSVVRCSSCYEQVNHQLRNLVRCHPVLGIFICKRCRKFYGKGSFCKDSDGYDEYCRLCAEGGDLLCCEQDGCFQSFCKRCIKRVLGRTELRLAEKAKNWSCYVCDKTPLMETRAMYRAIMHNLKTEEEKKTNLSRNELKSAEIKNKFALLKKNRLEKSLKTAQEKESQDKASKDKGSSNQKLPVKVKKPKAKADPWLREVIDKFGDMLQICLDNVLKIDSVWQKHDYSKESTEKTQNRIFKQLDAMEKNFSMMKDDMTASMGKDSAQQSPDKKVAKSMDDDKKVAKSMDDDKKAAKSMDDDKKAVKSIDEDKTGVKEDDQIEDTQDNPTEDKPEKKIGSIQLVPMSRLVDKENVAKSPIKEAAAEKSRNEKKSEKTKVDKESKNVDTKKKKEKEGKSRERKKTDDSEDAASEVEEPRRSGRSKPTTLDDSDKDDVDPKRKTRSNLRKGHSEKDREEGESMDGSEENSEGTSKKGRKSKKSSVVQEEKEGDGETSEIEKEDIGKISKNDKDVDKTSPQKKSNNKPSKIAGNADESSEKEDEEDVGKASKKEKKNVGDKTSKDEKEKKRDTESTSDKEKDVDKPSEKKDDDDGAKKLRGRTRKATIDNDTAKEKGQDKQGTKSVEESDDDGVPEDGNCSMDDINSVIGEDDGDAIESTLGNNSSVDKKDVSEAKGDRRRSKRKSSKDSDAAEKDTAGEKSVAKEQEKKDGHKTPRKGTKGKSDPKEGNKEDERESTPSEALDEDDDDMNKENGSQEKVDKEEKSKGSSKLSGGRRRSTRNQGEKDSDGKEAEKEKEEDTLGKKGKKDADVKVKKEEKKDPDIGVEQAETDAGKGGKLVKKEEKKGEDKKSKLEEDEEEKGGSKVKKEKKKVKEEGEDKDAEKETSDKSESKRKRKTDEKEDGKKPSSKRRKSKLTDIGDSDDSLLGIGSGNTDVSSDSGGDNASTQVPTKPSLKKKRVVEKKKQKKQKDETEEDDADTVDASEEKKVSPKKKVKVKMNKDNKAALSSLLASDSGSDNDDEKDSSGKDKKKLKNIDAKTVVTETSDSELDDILSSKSKKGTKKGKAGGGDDDNEKAKDALLKSESDCEVEDKPKPKCKKKNYKEEESPKPAEVKKNAKAMRKAQKKKEREEKRQKKEDEQLKGKNTVKVVKLSSEVLEGLKKDDMIDITDYSELSALMEQDTYDGDVEDEDSDQEFSRMMKFNVDGKFIKPGPKSKKKQQLMMSDSEDSDSDSDSDADDKTDAAENSNEDPIKEKVPKKKKEGLLDMNIEEDQDEEEQDEEVEGMKKRKKQGGITLNEKLKKNLLLSSDEEEEDDDDDNDEEVRDNTAEELKAKKRHELRKKKKEEEGDGDDKDEDKDEDKDDDKEDEEEGSTKVAKKGYVKLDITSDEDDDDFKGGNDDDSDEEDDDEDDSDFEESPRKRRTFQISTSDSDSEGAGKKKKKRKKDQSSNSESESSDEEETPKSKRRRIKKTSSSSDEGEEKGGDEENKDESPSKHKKIRRVIRDEDLLETTKNATQEEEERRKRIMERQKKYNQIFEIDVESDQKELGKLVLDFDAKSKKELICVNEKLVKALKPHQVQGIKFMFDSTIESVEMLKKKPGSGCILAHCMGLGKTLQVITYIHTLMTNKRSNQTIRHVMVCCPVNTVYNWVSEFSNWLKGKMLPFEVTELVSAKDLWGRAYRLDDWWREGGVCIMGYDMFRNLSNPKNKRYKGKMRQIFQETLVDPGPDIMVCDEGHILKNEKTALSIAINKIKTQRRIILTGTPLQNNLKEYHCMIQFVKPNLLGTKKEFMNRFVNPIEQGQCAEADQRDVKRMKRRAHILHNLLEGCVQRFDYTVLKPFLPPKFEYVISIQLSEVQVHLYQYYLDNLAQGGPKRNGSGLFVDYGALSRIWTHPKVLELAVRRSMLRNDDDDDELEDFICDDTTTEESSDDEKSKKKKKKTAKKSNEDEDDDDVIPEEDIDKDGTEEPGPIPGLTASGKVRIDWWKKVLAEKVGDNYEEDEYLDCLEHSGKLILLLDILRESCAIGDKVLVFSQSLLALDMMEEFLAFVDQGEMELPEPPDPLPMPYKKWKKERDYVRLDGSTSADARKQMCKIFNNPSNDRLRLFLISTRAGGLGINLVAANRVIVFDSSWNPSHDSQSIFRVYRFGQKKPCYVYRFVAQGTMEEKIYSRQVTKMSTALRVVDEHQIKRYFKMADLQQLYEFTPADKDTRETPAVPEDNLLAELLKRQKDWIVDYHEHDSLLENQTGEELNEEERKAAWEDYENEKKGMFFNQQKNSVMPVVGAGMGQGGVPPLSLAAFSFEGVVNTIRTQNPHLSQNEFCESVVLATKQIQRIHLNHYQRVQGMVYNLKNPMIAPEQRKLLPFGNHPEMLPMLEQQLRMLEDNIQRENQVINHMTQITPQRKDNHATMVSAGLVRGQTSSLKNEFGAGPSRFVTGATTSSGGQSTSGSSQTNPPTNQKDGSGDVIMLD